MLYDFKFTLEKALCWIDFDNKYIYLILFIFVDRKSLYVRIHCCVIAVHAVRNSAYSKTKLSDKRCKEENNHKLLKVLTIDLKNFLKWKLHSVFYIGIIVMVGTQLILLVFFFVPMYFLIHYDFSFFSVSTLDLTYVTSSMGNLLSLWMKFINQKCRVKYQLMKQLGS